MGRIPFKQVFKKSGSNTSAITENESWIGMFRVRMTDLEMARYGACNTLRILNNSSSSQKISLRFGLNNEGGEPSKEIKSQSVHNINVEDGQLFYGFDIMNLDGTTEIAIGEVQYIMARVEEQ